MLDMRVQHAKLPVMLLPEVKQAAEIVGGVGELCRRLRLTRSALHQWDEVPRGRVLEIEDITGGQISRYQLRPDLYPEPERVSQ